MSQGVQKPAKLRIALLGTRGVPARYGGFETAMEEIGRRLAAQGHEVVVYCRTGNSGKRKDPPSHQGMRLVHLPALKRRSLETLSHTLLSCLHLVLQRETYDAVVLCNAANAPALAILRTRRVPSCVHVDGLEWRRTKWGSLGRSYYRIAESLSVRWADGLIADAHGIQRYYEDEFGATTRCIAYGAPDMTSVGSELLAAEGLARKGFHLIVARFEPENNVDLMIEGYLRSKARLPLVVVGSTPYPTQYSVHITDLASRSESVRLLGGVWDQTLLNQLYSGALCYLHGHSVGGTNPSLLRAMGAGTHTIAFDVIFNREVAGETADYCSTADAVAAAVEQAELDTESTCAHGALQAERARACYTWDGVAADYLTLCRQLADGQTQRGSFSGRRTRAAAWREGRTPTLEAYSHPSPSLTIES